MCLYSGVYSILFLLIFKPFGLTRYTFSDQVFISVTMVLALITSLLFSWLILDYLLKFKRTNNLQKGIDFLARTILGAMALTATSFYYDVTNFTLKNILIFSGILLSMAFFPKLIYFLASYRFKDVEDSNLNNSNPLVKVPSQNKTETIEIDPNKILYVKSFSNYCEIVTDREENESSIIVRNTLKNVAKALKRQSILRCHRSYLVNVNYVQKHTSKKLTLKDNIDLPVSRKYKNSVKEIMTIS